MTYFKQDSMKHLQHSAPKRAKKWVERGNIGPTKEGVYASRYPGEAARFTTKDPLKPGDVAEVIMFEARLGACKELHVSETCDLERDHQQFHTYILGNEMKEYETLAQLRDYKHVVKVLAVADKQRRPEDVARRVEEQREALCIHMEALSVSVSDVLENFGGLPEGAVLCYLHQAALGLLTLKYEGIVHCDVKPANMMLTHHGVLKLTDFGLAQNSDDVGRCCGTAPYMAPELLDDHPHTYPSDIWALAASAVHMLKGARPFALVPNTPLDMRRVVFTKIRVPQLHDEEDFDECPGGTPTTGSYIPLKDMKQISATFQKLLDQCFKFAPTDRPKIDDVITQLGVLLMEHDDHASAATTSVVTSRTVTATAEFFSVDNTRGDETALCD